MFFGFRSIFQPILLNRRRTEVCAGAVASRNSSALPCRNRYGVAISGPMVQFAQNVYKMRVLLGIVIGGVMHWAFLKRFFAYGLI